jgi:putative two-component system response regulator
MANEKKTIILVDDNPSNLKIGKNVLSEKYNVFAAADAETLFELLEDLRPAIILLDIEMPVMNGYEAIKILKSKPEIKDIPVIFLTAKSDADSEFDGLSLGAIDYITKPFMPSLLLKRIEVHLLVESQQRELQDFNENLQKMVDEKTREVIDLQDTILKTVADLVESRDDVTGGHIERVQKSIGILIDALKKSGLFSDITKDWNKKLMLQSSQLHDVGKISIKDSILQKPARLTPDEFEEMKKHASFGVQIIEKIEKSTKTNDFLKYAKIFAGTHHERWDGKGYPAGLCGEAIPLEGRIMAVADVYDALTSVRPYKEAFTHKEAVNIILEGKGSQFDPVLTDLFVEIAEQFC